MAQNKLNLDALISREDFEILTTDTISQFSSTMQIRDLEPNAFLYRVLRKPDFQRETSEWSYKKIFEFIKSFLNGDLIPAIILWHSGGHIFVIDGAHRLSALIAWVHNDYGDSKISKEFFEHIIPDDQKDVAIKARNYIDKNIGSYEDHLYAISHPEKTTPEKYKQAKALASLAITLQWVNGNAKKAEDSFFKINQEATPINATERILLKSRKKPNAIAARAIIRSGTGHKYWSNFEDDIKNEIESIAKEINTILFEPSLKDPIKTLDLPVAGQVYSGKSLPLVFDTVNITNQVSMVSKDEKMVDDSDGIETIKYLKRTRKIIYRLSGIHPSSLGLHPIVYFYSSTGRYQPYSFIAIIELLQEFEQKDYYKKFITARKDFESFLLNHKDIQNQIAVKYGAGYKGSIYLKKLYLFIIEKILNKQTPAQIRKEIKEHKDYSFIRFSHDEEASNNKNFSKETKSQIFIKDALEKPIKCKICGGLIHKNSISIDHIQRKVDGGAAILDNGQLTHPYCNTTIKN